MTDTDSVVPSTRLLGVLALLFVAAAVVAACYFAGTPVTTWVDGIIK
jgi:hypothetical protein